MGAWADVIKVLRSPVFKNELSKLKPTKMVKLSNGFADNIALNNGVYLLYFYNNNIYETCILPVSITTTSNTTSKAYTSAGHTITFSKNNLTSTGKLSIQPIADVTMRIREI